MTRNPMPKQTFRAWLRHQYPGTIVGISRSSGHCPIAHACSAKGRPTAVADQIQWVLHETQPHEPTTLMQAALLPWQQRFIDIIDRPPGTNPITREAALAILEGADRG